MSIRSLIDPATLAMLNQMGISTPDIDRMLSGVLWLTVITVVFAIPTVWIAKRKGRSQLLWGILALSIPILPLLFVCFLPARKNSPSGT